MVFELEGVAELKLFSIKYIPIITKIKAIFFNLISFQNGQRMTKQKVGRGF